MTAGRGCSSGFPPHRQVAASEDLKEIPRTRQTRSTARGIFSFQSQKPLIVRASHRTSIILGISVPLVCARGGMPSMTRTWRHDAGGPGTRFAGLHALFFAQMSTARPAMSPGRMQRGERPGRDAVLAPGRAGPDEAWRKQVGDRALYHTRKTVLFARARPSAGTAHAAVQVSWSCSSRSTSSALPLRDRISARTAAEMPGMGRAHGYGERCLRAKWVRRGSDFSFCCLKARSAQEVVNTTVERP